LSQKNGRVVLLPKIIEEDEKKCIFSNSIVCGAASVEY
jgi:hypothetical protein